MSELMSAKSVRCCVGDCYNRRSKLLLDELEETGQVLFRFPVASNVSTNQEVLQKWTDFVREKRPDFIPNKYCYVCSDHFTFDCIELKSVLKLQFGMKTRPVLKSTAYPTIQKEGVETDTESISDTDESPALSTKTSNKEMLQDKNSPQSGSSTSTPKRGSTQAKSNSAKSLVSKNKSKLSEMTSTVTKCTTSRRSKSKTKVSTPEQNSTKSGKRSKKAQHKSSKKRKISEEPEVVIERWGEDEEEEGPEDGERGPQDGGRGPGYHKKGPSGEEQGSDDKEEDPTDPKISLSVKETRTEDLWKTEPSKKHDFLKEFWKTHIDPNDTEKYIQFRNLSSKYFRSNSPVQTKTTEPETLDVGCMTEDPETAANIQHVDLEKEVTSEEENDKAHKKAFVPESHIKQETEGSPNKTPDSGILCGEANAPSCKEAMLGDLTTSRCDTVPVGHQDKNIGLHQNPLLLDAACNTPHDLVENEFSSSYQIVGSHQESLMLDAVTASDFVEKEHGFSSGHVELNNIGNHQESLMLNATGCNPDGKVGINSVDLQDHFKSPSSSTGFDGVESTLHDQAFGVLKNPSDDKDNSGSDSDIALPMDEDENMIFCCSTCGDVQSVDGEPRLVICNDKTMKMTNSLSSEVMSVFCKKCSTDTETCFQCNGHIMRGNFKEHLKLHFG